MIGAFTGLIALGLAILPGFSYRIGRERKYPAKRTLGFRETALLLIPGLAFTYAGLTVFAVIRWWRPSDTPDIGALLKDGSSDYLRDHLPYIFGWTGAVIAISSTLGLLTGLFVTKVQGERRTKSSWMYHLKSGLYVECYLTDGSIVTGFIATLNNDYEESQDRDICLDYPAYWTPGAEDVTNSVDYEKVAIISASNISFLVAVDFAKPL
ncbi:MAG: hypothetical protein KTV68_15370 [Acidimicrobiia bacterium]|nr:hypothetical protein [Acidimicrobiia bacterium]